jgi:hypothetical protein
MSVPLWKLFIFGVSFERQYTYTNGKAARDYWDGILDSEINEHVHLMCMYYGNELKMVHVRETGAFVMQQISDASIFEVDPKLPF